MKFSIVLNGCSVMAEASNVNGLLAQMQGRELAKAGIKMRWENESAVL